MLNFGTHKTYKKFERILDVVGKKVKHPIETNLGKRHIMLQKNEKTKAILFEYFDWDNKHLFYIVITKNGRIHKLFSKIDDLAIHAAIYEIKKLLFKDKARKPKELKLTQLYRWY